MTCTHELQDGDWVIRISSVTIQETIKLVQLIVADDHFCKCRYLN
jgi:hypothetical protein